MTTTAEKINIMQAHEDGKPVEVNAGMGWLQLAIKNPAWNWCEFGYRIKPREPREFWINSYGSDGKSLYVHTSLKKAITHNSGIIERIRVIEVLEEE